MIALCLVVLLGGWVCFLKKQISDLSDRVTIMESEREARVPRAKRGSDPAQEKGPGVPTYTLE